VRIIPTVTHNSVISRSGEAGLGDGDAGYIGGHKKKEVLGNYDNAASSGFPQEAGHVNGTTSFS